MKIIIDKSRMDFRGMGTDYSRYNYIELEFEVKELPPKIQGEINTFILKNLKSIKE